jgi:asparagine synthase (glutamine-hydrolysing)
MSTACTRRSWAREGLDVCGICGWVGGPPEPAAEEVVVAMAEAIAHRGPDGEGHAAVSAEPGVYGQLGHRRLKILDLTVRANQPMRSEDGSVQLVFNGEAYNFRDLRSQLESRGHRFRSTGDTEVVMRAYLEWGEDFLERVDGMFALALWDGRREVLLLARDRVGKKPLFYARAGGRVTFGSEIKALARAPWIQLRPAMDQIPAFLAFGYAPWPATMYEDIRQVPPAGVLCFTPRHDRLDERSYWSALPSGPPLRADDAVIAELRRRVEEATRRRMVSDVPVGVLLSGGIDSSLVTALMQRNAEEPVKTFAVGFPEAPSFDERRHARRVADVLGTDHTEVVVRVDASQLLDRLVWLHDGPFGDSSAVPTYLICAAARSSVTVVLTGDGGDEVFAGYQRFAAAALARLVPPALLLPLRGVARRLPEGDGYFNARRRLARFAGRRGAVEQRYVDWISIFGDDARSALSTGSAGDPAATESFFAAHREAAMLPPIDRLIHANLRTYLPDDLATKLDRASMAHSLEARSPLLDTAVIELLSRVMAREKLVMHRIKPLLRRAFGPVLPEETWRRAKHGFGVPVDDWFAGELGVRFVDEVLGADGRLAQFLSAPELRRLWDDHRTGRQRNGAQLWTLLTLERWMRDLAALEPLREPRKPELMGAAA